MSAMHKYKRLWNHIHNKLSGDVIKNMYVLHSSLEENQLDLHKFFG